MILTLLATFCNKIKLELNKELKNLQPLELVGDHGQYGKLCKKTFMNVELIGILVFNLKLMHFRNLKKI